MTRRAFTAKRWTGREVKLLAAHAAAGIEIVRRALPGRPVAGIQAKARALGIAIKPGQRGSTGRWRGKIPIPPHAHPLVRRFIVELNHQQAHLYEVAERIGSTVDMLSEWRYRRVPRLDNFEAALNALGLRLVIAPMRRGGAGDEDGELGARAAE